jgi:PHP family Zn ribbon phosphoesterase
MTLTQLRKAGFDKSKRDGKYNHVACSQCQALVVNGHATHEYNCPNRKRVKR